MFRGCLASVGVQGDIMMESVAGLIQYHDHPIDVNVTITHTCIELSSIFFTEKRNDGRKKIVKFERN